MPEGTSRQPETTSTCKDGGPMELTYRATRAQSWIVRIRVIVASAADCPERPIVGDRCTPIARHPGFIGGENASANTPGNQAFVFGCGYRADIFSSVSSFDSAPAPADTPDGTAIAVSVLTAITG